MYKEYSSRKSNFVWRHSLYTWIEFDSWMLSSFGSVIIPI